MTYLVAATFVLLLSGFFAWFLMRIAIASAFHVANCIEAEDLSCLNPIDCNLAPQHKLESSVPTTTSKAEKSLPLPMGAMLAR